MVERHARKVRCFLLKKGAASAPEATRTKSGGGGGRCYFFCFNFVAKKRSVGCFCFLLYPNPEGFRAKVKKGECDAAIVPAAVRLHASYQVVFPRETRLYTRVCARWRRALHTSARRSLTPVTTTRQGLGGRNGTGKKKKKNTSFETRNRRRALLLRSDFRITSRLTERPW